MEQESKVEYAAKEYAAKKYKMIYNPDDPLKRSSEEDFKAGWQAAKDQYKQRDKFFIDEISPMLKAFSNKEMSISKFVEQLNEMLQEDKSDWLKENPPFGFGQ